MRRRTFLAIVPLIGAILISSPLLAESDPASVMRITIDQALEVLRDPKLRAPEKRRERIGKIRVIADRVFDWEEMAQSSLGPTYRTITDAQRKEFVTLFKDLIAEEYMDDLDRFVGDETIEIKGVEKRDEQRVVKTILITHGRERVPIDYFMHREEQAWFVHDFSVEGVSLVNHYRKSFARYLANRTFDQLIERLRSRSRPK